MPDMSGPAWLTCLGNQVTTYEDDISYMDDDTLMDEYNRVEITNPPTDPQYNDRDWRLYRRLIRQEIHNRDL